MHASSFLGAMLLPLLTAAAPASGATLVSRQTGDFPNTRPCSVAIAYENNEVVGGDPSSGAGVNTDSTLFHGWVGGPDGNQITDFGLDPDGGGDFHADFQLPGDSSMYQVHGHFNGFSAWDSCSVSSDSGASYDGSPGQSGTFHGPINAGQYIECDISFSCLDYHG